MHFKLLPITRVIGQGNLFALRRFPSASFSAYQANDQQEDYSTDDGRDDGVDDSRADGDAELAKHPAADYGANNADDDVDQDALAAALDDDLASQPAMPPTMSQIRMPSMTISSFYALNRGARLSGVCAFNSNRMPGKVQIINTIRSIASFSLSLGELL